MDRHDPVRRTRLAPSPTGALHLGNARTFVINWILARRFGWEVELRIDDLDGPRVKPKADAQAIEDLRWLGLDWDTGPVRQSSHITNYRDRLQSLARQGAMYPCRCTRKQIEAAALSAPHAGDHEVRYPGTCRPTGLESQDYPSRLDTIDDAPNWRLALDDVEVDFVDEIAGTQSFNVHRTVGDFLVATRQGEPSYQLAVVIDDELAGVTDIVRGDDLLPSTARQILVRKALDIDSPLRYWHLPLIVGPDGKRLAKRHGDTRVTFYREHGVPRERIIGLIAAWSGVGTRQALSLEDFASAFDLEAMTAAPVTMTDDDDQWLRGSSSGGRGP